MTRAELHEILDALPETDLPAAEKALRKLGDAAVLQALDRAPLDDEPDDDDHDGQLTEARRDAAQGRGVTTEELRKRLRLP
ncbi:MAG TPA: hypothetical protein VHQ90_16475 [Thermoanaerobaculia bacterium]|nr:hypothetical protein [Thermoanaerobaculia bacterium]